MSFNPIGALNINPSLLLQAATQAAGLQHYPAGTLYVVATPIGHLADLTLRAIHVLSRVDAVACEDTRVSAQLLRHLGLDKPLLPVHQHNEQEGAARVLERLARGQSVAYVSDAGTPVISDPGATVVAAAAAQGYRVVPVPGASAVAAALSVSGDDQGKSFTFTGFLPAKGAERQAALVAVADALETQVLFEAPHRIQALALALAERVPQRRITLGRELTKQFETVATMPCVALPAWLAADSHRERGEFVLVLHARAAAPVLAGLPPETERTLTLLMRDLPLKQAVSLAAELTGAARNALYDRALVLRDA
jgi:16S rRNA (cytidine1402-2'-O)-methyltransferase